MILANPNLQVVRRGDPDYRPRTFRLTSPLKYLWVRKRCIVTVPAGTLTNFASVPFGFRNIVAINDDHRLPATLHDYLYEKAGSITVEAVESDNGVYKRVEPQVILYTRNDADREFKHAMRLEGCSRFTATAMYKAVDIFGGLHLRLTGGKEWKKPQK